MHATAILAAFGFVLVVGQGTAGAWTASSLGSGAPTLAALSAQQFNSSQFMEDTPEEIYVENRVNPWQAWALAFFPTAIVKGVTISLAASLSAEQSWAPYLTLVPSMGQSHFWETGVWWAGLIALGGDLISGALLTFYFSEYHASTPTTRPEKTMLYAGIGVLAVFFLYENISAPVVANWQNKRLRRQFKPASDEDARAIRGPDSGWRFSPWPDHGVAQIGPDIRSHTPVGAAYSFSF
jgi:hypothetical protein